MIVMAGMIGAGKSTVAEMVAEELGTEVFFESVEDNRILDRFYYDQKRWAFALQIYFLNSRFRSIKKALQGDNNILDRSIYEDAIFARQAFEDGNMDEAEFDIYLELLDNMMEESGNSKKSSPDLLVFLNGSFDTILLRIAKRGREYEQQDALIDYYKRLYDRYQEWIKNYDKSPVLTIDIDKYDVTKQDEADKVLGLIKSKLDQLGLIKNGL